jgi:hypothetical protein
MLKLYVQGQDLLARLRASQEGVVSFEYVIVAACVIAAVAAAFGTSTSTGIGAALKTGIDTITAAFTTAITPGS